MDTKEVEARGKLLRDLALMGRMDERWRKLYALVEGKELTADSALRGFRLAIDAVLRQPILEDELTSASSAVGREELERLRSRIAELEHETEVAKLANELQDARVTELEGLLAASGEATRQASDPDAPRDSKPQLVSPPASGGAGKVRPSVPPTEEAADPVEYWRKQVCDFYRDSGFNIPVPSPVVSPGDLENWSCSGWELFYRPAEREVSYEQLMSALGYPGHSTLSPDERSQIKWEPAEEGYWFLAETWVVCPPSQRGKTYEDHLRSLPAGHRLLSLEEWVIFWHVMRRTVPGVFLDSHDCPIILRTERVSGEVLQARANVSQASVEIIVRGWMRKLAYSKLSARYSRMIESSL